MTAFETHMPVPNPKIYRRLKDRDVWHYMPSCQHWPSAEQVEVGSAVERDKKPTSGELCDECQAKERKASRR